MDTLVRSIDHFVHGFGRTDTTVALLGFGDCVPALKRQVRELGLDDYVVFTGRADIAMIERYLSTADIGLSSDPLNPLNDVSTMNKTLEYMAYSLPVVAYDLVETRVSAGGAAVYVTPGDEKGYAHELIELLDDPERRAELGANGRLRIERSLSWRYSEAVYVQVYDELLGVAPAPVPADVTHDRVIWLDAPMQRDVRAFEQVMNAAPPQTPEQRQPHTNGQSATAHDERIPLDTTIGEQD